MELHVIKTPVRTSVANAICERVIGTLRRECLDFVIPLNERHLYGILKEWLQHYNESRPHMSLGPGIPSSSAASPLSRQAYWHRMPTVNVWWPDPLWAVYTMHMDGKNGPLEDAANVLVVMDAAIVNSEVCNMTTDRVVIPGIVKNGPVVPQSDTPLPDGTYVDIVITPADMSPELKAELDQWDQASEEAWAMIDEWEAEQR
jgi:hypothetical protein